MNDTKTIEDFEEIVEGIAKHDYIRHVEPNTFRPLLYDRRIDTFYYISAELLGALMKARV